MGLMKLKSAVGLGKKDFLLASAFQSPLFPHAVQGSALKANFQILNRCLCQQRSVRVVSGSDESQNRRLWVPSHFRRHLLLTMASEKGSCRCQISVRSVLVYIHKLDALHLAVQGRLANSRSSSQRHPPQLQKAIFPRLTRLNE